MRKTNLFFTVLSLTLATAGIAGAAELAKSASYKIHSAYYFTGTATQVGENRMYFDGPYWGVSFNNEGAGFLHHAAWNCPGLSHAFDGSQTTIGFCTINDAERGVIHGDWTGGGKVGGEFKGQLTFKTGSGGYAGISGSLTFSCFPASADGRQLRCEQSGTYRLP